MPNRAWWIVLLAAALAGCRGPFHVHTSGRMIVHSSVVEDRGPLAEMPVMPDRGQPCGKIALIDVDGILLNMDMSGYGSVGENPVALFREKLDQVAADPCYCAVVLRINSPGGGVTASDVMWRDLRALKSRTGLPVVACLMDTGTGGAYYVATAADHIVAHPTTITGGMGVILNLYNLQDTLAQFNILATPIRAGKYADLGTPVELGDDESREILQHIADKFHARFRDVVRQSRPAHDPNREEDFDGRIFTGDEALGLKLVDSVGYLDDAVAIARQMGQCPTAQVVILHRSNDRARSPYAVTPNVPLQGSVLPLSLPGLDRSEMPAFLYLWQPEPTYPRRASGR